MGLATAIPSGSDLDDYTTAGTYRCATGAIAASLPNCPVSAAFRLEVKNLGASSRFVQVLYVNSQTVSIYVRVNTDTYGGWYKLAATAV